MLVLAHDPASFAAVPRGLIATVSGHTHGGQIRLPFLGAVVNAKPGAPLRWTHGHVIEDERHLVVSAGAWNQQPASLRLNCPPEIVELVIEAGRS